MNSFKTIFLLTILFFPDFSFGQENQREFSKILQTYYTNKDKDLINVTIKELNKPNSDFNRYKPILTGFYGALFSIDTIVKNNFKSNLDKLNNEKYKNLFKYLVKTNIDTIYLRTPLSPEYNDMNWASFFATADIKFIDNIVANIPLSENRIDRNLFFTGATAKWSLCSNAKQNKLVKNHLENIKSNNKYIKEILKKEPQEYKQEIIETLKKQQEKGLWTE